MPSSTPTSLDGFHSQWLTEELRQAGTIAAASRVETVRIERLGEGEGFVGDLARLHLGYSGEPGPATVVAKIPTAVELNRAMGRALGVYEREVMMYREILPSLPVPHPTVHVGRYEADGTEASELERIKRANRLPMALLRLLVRSEQKNARVPPCVLLLADIADELGDQVAGCDVERAATVLATAADIHAPTWGVRSPQSQHWLTGGDVAPRVFDAVYRNNRREFERRANTTFSEHSQRVLRSLRRNGAGRIRHLHTQAPTCLLHGDLRLDNIFFSPEGTVSAIIDWQTANLGPAVLDVGYFITGSLGHDVPESTIDDLLDVYHQRLLANGVEDYSLKQLHADYDQALRVLLHRMSAIGGLNFGDARGQELLDRWLMRFDARLARVTP